MVRRLEGAEGNMSSEWSIWQAANLNSVYILILLGPMFILTLSDVDGITPEILSLSYILDCASLRIFTQLL